MKYLTVLCLALALSGCCSFSKSCYVEFGANQSFTPPSCFDKSDITTAKVLTIYFGEKCEVSE